MWPKSTYKVPLRSPKDAQPGLYYRKQHLIRSSLPTSHDYHSARFDTNARSVFGVTNDTADELAESVPPTAGEEPNASPFAKQWGWVGTQDFSPYLAVPAALQFREDLLGGERRLNEYCHNLAIQGGQAAAKVLGTSILETDSQELTANMVAFSLAFDLKMTN